MKVALVAMSVLALVALALFLEGRHTEQPDDPSAPPRGPSTLLRGIRRRAALRQAQEIQGRALEMEGALQMDAGAAPATP